MLAKGAAPEKRNRLDGGAAQARRWLMAKPSCETSKPAPPAPEGDAAREQRLAEALRANLRRRKVAIQKPATRTEKD